MDNFNITTTTTADAFIGALERLPYSKRLEAAARAAVNCAVSNSAAVHNLVASLFSIGVGPASPVPSVPSSVNNNTSNNNNSNNDGDDSEWIMLFEGQRSGLPARFHYFQVGVVMAAATSNLPLLLSALTAESELAKKLCIPRIVAIADDAALISLVSGNGDGRPLVAKVVRSLLEECIKRKRRAVLDGYVRANWSNPAVVGKYLTACSSQLVFEYLSTKHNPVPFNETKYGYTVESTSNDYEHRFGTSNKGRLLEFHKSALIQLLEHDLKAARSSALAMTNVNERFRWTPEGFAKMRVTEMWRWWISRSSFYQLLGSFDTLDGALQQKVFDLIEQYPCYTQAGSYPDACKPAVSEFINKHAPVFVKISINRTLPLLYEDAINVIKNHIRAFADADLEQTLLAIGRPNALVEDMDSKNSDSHSVRTGYYRIKYDRYGHNLYFDKDTLSKLTPAQLLRYMSFMLNVYPAEATASVVSMMAVSPSDSSGLSMPVLESNNYVTAWCKIMVDFSLTAPEQFGLLVDILATGASRIPYLLLTLLRQMLVELSKRSIPTKSDTDSKNKKNKKRNKKKSKKGTVVDEPAAVYDAVKYSNANLSQVVYDCCVRRIPDPIYLVSILTPSGYDNIQFAGLNVCRSVTSAIIAAVQNHSQNYYILNMVIDALLAVLDNVTKFDDAADIRDSNTLVADILHSLPGLCASADTLADNVPGSDHFSLALATRFKHIVKWLPFTDAATRDRLRAHYPVDVLAKFSISAATAVLVFIIELYPNCKERAAIFAQLAESEQLKSLPGMRECFEWLIDTTDSAVRHALIVDTRSATQSVREKAFTRLIYAVRFSSDIESWAWLMDQLSGSLMRNERLPNRSTLLDRLLDTETISFEERINLVMQSSQAKAESRSTEYSQGLIGELKPIAPNFIQVLNSFDPVTGTPESAALVESRILGGLSAITQQIIGASDFPSYADSFYSRPDVMTALSQLLAKIAFSRALTPEHPYVAFGLRQSYLLVERLFGLKKLRSETMFYDWDDFSTGIYNSAVSSSDSASDASSKLLPCAEMFVRSTLAGYEYWISDKYSLSKASTSHLSSGHYRHLVFDITAEQLQDAASSFASIVLGIITERQSTNKKQFNLAKLGGEDDAFIMSLYTLIGHQCWPHVPALRTHAERRLAEVRSKAPRHNGLLVLGGYDWDLPSVPSSIQPALEVFKSSIPDLDERAQLAHDSEYAYDEDSRTKAAAKLAKLPKLDSLLQEYFDLYMDSNLAPSKPVSSATTTSNKDEEAALISAREKAAKWEAMSFEQRYEERPSVIFEHEYQRHFLNADPDDFVQRLIDAAFKESPSESSAGSDIDDEDKNDSDDGSFIDVEVESKMHTELDALDEPSDIRAALSLDVPESCISYKLDKFLNFFKTRQVLLYRLLPRQTQVLGEWLLAVAFCSLASVSQRDRAIAYYMRLPSTSFVAVTSLIAAAGLVTIEEAEKQQYSNALNEAAVAAGIAEKDATEKKADEVAEPKPPIVELPAACHTRLISGLLVTDEPQAPLRFMLQPEMLDWNSGRIALFCLRRLSEFVTPQLYTRVIGGILSGDLPFLNDLVDSMSGLMKKKKRPSLKVGINKEIIRMLAELPSKQHRFMIKREFTRWGAHRDVMLLIFDILTGFVRDAPSRTTSYGVDPATGAPIPADEVADWAWSLLREAASAPVAYARNKDSLRTAVGIEEPKNAIPMELSVKMISGLCHLSTDTYPENMLPALGYKSKVMEELIDLVKETSNVAFHNTDQQLMALEYILMPAVRRALATLAEMPGLYPTATPAELNLYETTKYDYATIVYYHAYNVLFGVNKPQSLKVIADKKPELIHQFFEMMQLLFSLVQRHEMLGIHKAAIVPMLAEDQARVTLWRNSYISTLSCLASTTEPQLSELTKTAFEGLASLMQQAATIFETAMNRPLVSGLAASAKSLLSQMIHSLSYEARQLSGPGAVKRYYAPITEGPYRALFADTMLKLSIEHWSDSLSRWSEPDPESTTAHLSSNCDDVANEAIRLLDQLVDLLLSPPGPSSTRTSYIKLYNSALTTIASECFGWINGYAHDYNGKSKQHGPAMLRCMLNVIQFIARCAFPPTPDTVPVGRQHVFQAVLFENIEKITHVIRSSASSSTSKEPKMEYSRGLFSDVSGEHAWSFELVEKLAALAFEEFFDTGLNSQYGLVRELPFNLVQNSFKHRETRQLGRLRAIVELMKTCLTCMPTDRCSQFVKLFDRMMSFAFSPSRCSSGSGFASDATTALAAAASCVDLMVKEIGTLFFQLQPFQLASAIRIKFDQAVSRSTPDLFVNWLEELLKHGERVSKKNQLLVQHGMIMYSVSEIAVIVTELLFSDPLEWTVQQLAEKLASIYGTTDMLPSVIKSQRRSTKRLARRFVSHHREMIANYDPSRAVVADWVEKCSNPHVVNMELNKKRLSVAVSWTKAKILACDLFVEHSHKRNDSSSKPKTYIRLPFIMPRMIELIHQLHLSMVSVEIWNGDQLVEPSISQACKLIRIMNNSFHKYRVKDEARVVTVFAKWLVSRAVPSPSSSTALENGDESSRVWWMELALDRIDDLKGGSRITRTIPAKLSSEYSGEVKHAALLRLQQLYDKLENLVLDPANGYGMHLWKQRFTKKHDIQSNW
ncbi:hypothetical protein GQ42DRAFT_164982 [Ramicandelaber brevisporus]|nr:hypothetical protein GQ42DRAFT_164982 [Ramicandelaber brevisporus]